jgi:hypothetical protein
MTSFTSQIASLIPDVFHSAFANAQGCSYFSYCSNAEPIRCWSCVSPASGGCGLLEGECGVSHFA